MSLNRLQVGVDSSQNGAHVCLLLPDGQPLDLHHAVDNSLPGYSRAKRLLLDALASSPCDGVDVSGEATGLLLAADPDLAAHDLNLFLRMPEIG